MRFLPIVALGLSLFAAACSSPNDDAASSAAAVTAPNVEPGAPQTISKDGRDAVGTLLVPIGSMLADATTETGALVKEWLETSASEVYVVRHDTGATFYFSGNVIVEGDIIEGSKQLIIEQTFNGVWGPGYLARRGDGSVPRAALQLHDADASAVRAIAGLANLAMSNPDAPAAIELKKFTSQTTAISAVEVQKLAPAKSSFVLYASIIEGGDMNVGEAELRFVQSYEGEIMGFPIVTYEASAFVTMDK